MKIRFVICTLLLVSAFVFAAEKQTASSIDRELAREVSQLMTQQPPKTEEAKTMLQKSSEAGSATAVFYLGNLEEHMGQSENSQTTANAHYRQAAEMGLTDAMVRLMWFYLEGEEPDYKHAKEYAARIEKTSEVEAINHLGNVYATGGLGEIDREKAKELYLRAVELGMTDAYVNLGRMYTIDQEGQKKDYSKAMEWYKVGADLGDAKSLHNIGLLYLLGNGVEKDLKKAVEYFEKAAEKDFDEALVNLSYIYADEEQDFHDMKKAFAYAEEAAYMANPQALYNLGAWYATGKGVKQDDIAATAWMGFAATLGYEPAQQAMRELLSKVKQEDYPKVQQLQQEILAKLQEEERKSREEDDEGGNEKKDDNK